MEDELRYINKAFKCENCSTRFKKLVHSSESSTTCPSCHQSNANEIEPSEFNRETIDRSYRLTFIDGVDPNLQSQYHPRTDIFDTDPRNLYGDPRTRIPRQEERTATEIPRQQPQASPTSQTRQQPQTSSTSQASTRPTETARQRPRGRVYNMNFYIPFNISPFRGSVNRLPLDGFFFDNFFDTLFFMPAVDVFTDNFSSNFNSNFMDPLTRIIFVQSMQNQPTGTPPTSREAISRLKRFKMTEEYCKKDPKDNTIEYPTCSVCLTEISKDAETVLIPCGHMYHNQCILKWLEMHSTCPVCRYQLPTEGGDTEERGGSGMNDSTFYMNGRVA